MHHIFHHVKIDAIKGLIGKESLSVTDLGSIFKIPEKKLNRIIRTNGFESLSIIPNTLSIGDLAVFTSRSLLQEIGFDVTKIDALIMVTQVPDYMIPPTSFTVQQRIDIRSSASLFDIVQGCPGYVNGLLMASCMIESGAYKHVLLCAGEVSSRIYNKNSESMESSLDAGDGFSATLLSYSEDLSDMEFYVSSDGNFFNTVIDYGYGNKAGRCPDNNSSKGFCIDGNSYNKYVLDNVSSVIKNFLNESTFADFGVCVAQQSSASIIKALSCMLNSPNNWIPFTARQIGNLSSASIPLALSELKGQLDLSKKILFAGFGVGLATSVCSCSLSQTKILPVLRV